MVVIRCKKKYRPKGGDDDYYWAKKIGPSGDHQGNKKRRKTGENTYNPRLHPLVLLKNGKLRTLHLDKPI